MVVGGWVVAAVRALNGLKDIFIYLFLFLFFVNLFGFWVFLGLIGLF